MDKMEDDILEGTIAVLMDQSGFHKWWYTTGEENQKNIREQLLRHVIRPVVDGSLYTVYGRSLIQVARALSYWDNHHEPLGGAEV